MKTARRIAGLTATMALLACPGLAQAAPANPPPGLPKPAPTCTFSTGVWTCYGGSFASREEYWREVPVGEYGDCTDGNGDLGTPTVNEVTYRPYTITIWWKYRANGDLIGDASVRESGEPYVVVVNQFCAVPA